MRVDISTHPCFNKDAKNTHGRVHLPVAPRCNVQCNFCDRKFDCVNESRPGVTSTILTPHQALAYYRDIRNKNENISVVGIAGPGDPFANPNETMETLRLIRAEFPDVILCLATNGLNLYPYLDELAELEVSHVTITVNAVDPEIGAKIYSWLRPAKITLRSVEGAKILLEEQLKCIKKMKELGLIVKINSVVVPGINDNHIVEIAKTVSELGADIFNPMAYYNNPGSNFGHIETPSKELIHEIRNESKQYMNLMLHCQRCRSDAIGLISDEMKPEQYSRLVEFSKLQLVPAKDKPNVAVATNEGMLVNQHLGEAEELYIFQDRDGSYELLEKRPLPSAGGGMNRWQEVAETISDCSYLLVSGIGETPKSVLAEHGIEVRTIEGMISEALNGIYKGIDINHMIKRTRTKCGESCTGSGTGCG